MIRKIKQWLLGETVAQRPPVVDLFGLTNEEIFLKIREIEPGYYVDYSHGAYYSCGVAGTSWPYYFSSAEACLHHAFKRFCGGFHTRKYKTYRFEGGGWIETTTPPIRDVSGQLKCS